MNWVSMGFFFFFFSFHEWGGVVCAVVHFMRVLVYACAVHAFFENVTFLWHSFNWK